MSSSLRPRTLMCLTAASLLALAVASAQADGIVYNGDFDTIYKPGTSQTVHATDVSGWADFDGDSTVNLSGGQVTWSDSSVTNPSDAEKSLEVPGWAGYGGLMLDGDAASGKICFLANDNATIYPTVSLGTIAANTDYTFSMAARCNNGNSVYLRMLPDNVQVLDARVIAVTGSWADYSTTYTAAELRSYVGQSIGLLIGGAGTGGEWPRQVRIDNIGLTATAVPEPGTLVSLAAGLVGLLAYAWRKRK